MRAGYFIMKNLWNILKTCILFKNMEITSIDNLLSKSNYSINYYNKDTFIAYEGDSCTSIGIVLSGNIEIQKAFASGKTVTIAKLSSGNIFGEVIIFSEVNKYPSTILSASDTSVLFISKTDIIKLCSLNNIMLSNFMGLLSNKILVLNKKLKNLSYETLRQRITNLLLEYYTTSNCLMFQLEYSRQEMAEQLGVPRPSLSRELSNMKNDGLIDYHKNTFKILDLGKLENILF